MIPRRVDAGDINRRNRRTRKGIITVELEGGGREGVLSWDERVLERDPLRVRIKTQFAYTWFQHLWAALCESSARHQALNRFDHLMTVSSTGRQ